jgi:hypothetical protein
MSRKGAPLADVHTSCNVGNDFGRLCGGQTFEPSQAEQNPAFLNVLRRTGNIGLAASEAGAKYGTCSIGGGCSLSSRRDGMRRWRLLGRGWVLLSWVPAYAGMTTRVENVRRRATHRSAEGRFGPDQTGSTRETYSRLRAGVSCGVERDRECDASGRGGGRLPTRFLSAQAAVPGLRSRDADGAADGLRPDRGSAAALNARGSL